MGRTVMACGHILAAFRVKDWNSRGPTEQRRISTTEYKEEGVGASSIGLANVLRGVNRSAGWTNLPCRLR
jgi:hypothetical protein